MAKGGHPKETLGQELSEFFGGKDPDKKPMRGPRHGKAPGAMPIDPNAPDYNRALPHTGKRRGSNE